MMLFLFSSGVDLRAAHEVIEQLICSKFTSKLQTLEPKFQFGITFR